MDKITYGRQTINQDDIEEVVKALKSASITQGEYVPAFEKALQEYTGAKYAVAVSSGTAALHTAYAALGLSKNHEIITCPNTFAATSNAALYLNAKVKFADINIEDFLIDEEKIEEKINENTKIITPIHYAGLPCSMDKIYELAQKYNIKIVEDACHAVGSVYKGSITGSCKYSDAAVFSFHPVKHITTAEGGAVLTNNEEVYKKCLLYRSHGMEKVNFKNIPDSPTYHEMQLLGYNYRMTDIQAAIGLGQLERYEEMLKRRHEIIARYDNALSPFKVTLLKHSDSDMRSSGHLYFMRVNGIKEEERNDIIVRFAERGIATNVHYKPLPMLTAYKNMGFNIKDYPNAFSAYENEITLPLYSRLTDEEVDYIVCNAADILKEYMR